MTQVELNDVGDMVLTEAATLRALADPARLALVDRLTRGGAATVVELAEHLGLESAAAQGHVEALADAGLLVADGDAWRTVGRGVFFEIPESGPEDIQLAARELSNAMLLNYEQVPRDWVEKTEPDLELDWARSAGLFNAGMTVTAEELRTIQEDLETMLKPYLNRTEPPEGSRRIRMLAYFLPTAGA